jgi:hypothetical protein
MLRKDAVFFTAKHAKGAKKKEGKVKEVSNGG